MNLALLVRIKSSIFSIFKKYVTFHVTHPGKMGAFRVVGVPVVLYTLLICLPAHNPFQGPKYKVARTYFY